jgi:hypothetical protein
MGWLEVCFPQKDHLGDGVACIPCVMGLIPGHLLLDMQDLC